MEILYSIGNILGRIIGISIGIAIITLPITVPIIVYQIRKKRRSATTNYQPTNSAQVIIQQQNILPYEINDSLLTNKEKAFYNALKHITDKYEYIILSKMRIADIVRVTASKEEFLQWFNKINKKHIDFIICNKEFRPLLLIEIDDYTHDRADRIERDKFVDEIFKNRNINLIHIRQWKIENLESIIINNIVSPQATYNLNT